MSDARNPVNQADDAGQVSRRGEGRELRERKKEEVEEGEGKGVYESLGCITPGYHQSHHCYDYGVLLLLLLLLLPLPLPLLVFPGPKDDVGHES